MADVKLYRSRVGDVGKAVRRAIEQLRQSGAELTASQEVTASLAVRAAAVVDAAYRADDPDRMLRAAERVTQLLARLEGKPAPAGGGDDAGSGGGDELERALRAAPTMGD